jgi:hypothetical protein
MARKIFNRGKLSQCFRKKVIPLIQGIYMESLRERTSLFPKRCKLSLVKKWVRQTFQASRKRLRAYSIPAHALIYQERRHLPRTLGTTRLFRKIPLPSAL